MVVPRSYGQDYLADVHAGNETVGLAKGTTHAGLQSIGTSARQHLVDTDHMVRVGADTEMETFLSGNLDEVLVGANTGGFESLGGQLLVLIGDKVDAKGEVVNASTLAAEIEDTDFRVGHTTVEARLGVLEARYQSNLLFFKVFLHVLIPACSCSSGSNGLVVVPLCRSESDL